MIGVYLSLVGSAEGVLCYPGRLPQTVSKTYCLRQPTSSGTPTLVHSKQHKYYQRMQRSARNSEPSVTRERGAERAKHSAPGRSAEGGTEREGRPAAGAGDSIALLGRDGRTVGWGSRGQCKGTADRRAEGVGRI